MKSGWCSALVLAALCRPAWCGPYAASGIPSSSPAFVGWATGVVSLTRGPQDIATPGSPLATYGSPANALGPADGTFGVVSLGDGGQITVSFAAPIVNGPGADFAVFENGFTYNGGVFAELGFVEVSSDGTNFFRFPSVSLTQTQTQVGPFDVIDPTNIHNLAGQFPALQGTPFDLQDLAGVSPLLDINDINYVRIVDVVGSIDPAFGSVDSLGNPINDPFPTDFPSSGFDLDAVGVFHQAPLPASLVLLVTGVGSMGLPWLRRRLRRRKFTEEAGALSLAVA